PAAPAWVINSTLARWSAGILRNQGSCSSMAATLALASRPEARSSARSVDSDSSCRARGLEAAAPTAGGVDDGWVDILCRILRPGGDRPTIPATRVRCRRPLDGERHV